MTILVTGGCGFIGSNFIFNWESKQNENIVVIDKLTYAGNFDNSSFIKNKKNYYFYKVDINEQEKITNILNKYKPRFIINFAAESHVDRSILGPENFIKSNIQGTYHLLEAVKNYYFSLNSKELDDFRFLHISTDEVYGSLNDYDEPFTEENKYEPNSPYSASKAASDHLVRAWNKTFNVPTLTSNCSNNYGPFQFPEKLIPLCIMNALNNKDIPIYGDGLQIRDWLYVNDHCEALKLILDNGVIGETYNIGGLCEKNNLHVVKTICDLLDDIKPKKNGNSYSEQITFVKDRPGHDRRYAINASKLTNDLGWKPVETFESGILKTLEWYINNEKWIENIQTGNYINSYNLFKE